VTSAARPGHRPPHPRHRAAPPGQITVIPNPTGTHVKPVRRSNWGLGGVGRDPGEQSPTAELQLPGPPTRCSRGSTGRRCSCWPPWPWPCRPWPDVARAAPLAGATRFLAGHVPGGIRPRLRAACSGPRLNGIRVRDPAAGIRHRHRRCVAFPAPDPADAGDLTLCGRPRGRQPVRILCGAGRRQNLTRDSSGVAGSSAYRPRKRDAIMWEYEHGLIVARFSAPRSAGPSADRPGGTGRTLSYGRPRTPRVHDPKSPR